MKSIIILLAIAYIALIFHGTAIAELFTAGAAGLALAFIPICVCEQKKRGNYPHVFNPKTFFYNAIRLNIVVALSIYVSAIFHVETAIEVSLLTTHQQVLGLISTFQTFLG